MENYKKGGYRGKCNIIVSLVDGGIKLVKADPNADYKEQIGQLAIMHYKARKEVEKLKKERRKFPELDYNDGLTWETDDIPERKKLTDDICYLSEKGRIARCKMTYLIKKIINK